MWGETHTGKSLWKNPLGFFVVKYKEHAEVTRLSGVIKVANSSVD